MITGIIHFLKVRTQLLCSVLFLISFAAQAQLNLENLEFHTVDKNIFQRPITAMIKDHDGFIWIGTDGAGLYKYNGLSYSYYGHNLDDTNSINGNSVNSLLVDTSGSLWVGTNAGLCVYNKFKNTFTRIGNQTTDNPTEGYTSILCLAEYENHLLAGTYDGVKKINTENRTIENHILSGTPVLDLKFSTKGNLYIATNDGLKLEQYHQRGKIEKLPIHEESVQPQITKLQIDENENLWVGTIRQGVYRSDLKKTRKTFTKLNIRNSRTMAIASGNDQVFVAIENEGLVILDKNGSVLKQFKYNVQDDYSLGSDSVWSFLYDDENRLWLGYYEDGLGFIDQYHNKFKALRMEDGKNTIQTNDIRAFAKTENGAIWIAQTNALDRLNTNTGEVTNAFGSVKPVYKGLKEGIFIEDIFIDSKDNLWVATWGQGIFLLKKNENTFLNFTTESTNGTLATNKVQCFTEDRHGRIWVGSFLKGVFYIDSSTLQINVPAGDSYTNSDIVTKDIKVIHHDSNGFIWVGTSSGLYHITEKNEKEFTVIAHSSAISSKFAGHPSSNQILDIYETQDGTVWYGTNGGGLFSYNRETKGFERFELKNQDLTYVNAIFEPIKNELWLSSKSGILKVDRNTKKVTKFTTHDGLLKNFAIDGSIVLDNNGKLYLGTKKGINTIELTNVLRNPHLAKTYLKGVKISNTSVNRNDDNSPLDIGMGSNKISLKHNQTTLTIDYGAISYTRPENNQYAYSLENFENTWNHVGQQTSATYTNLEPGEYLFKLKASNNDGLWNNASTILEIEVLPPWWKTLWAYTLYFILATLLALTTMFFYRKQVEEKNNLRLERERRKQKVDLQQQKLQFFTNISHEFRTPLTLIINPIKELLDEKDSVFSQSVKEKHHIIHKNADRLSRLINELMDFRKLQSNKLRLSISQFKLVEQTKNILSFFNEETKRRSILLDLKYKDVNLDIWADKGILDKIFFNLLSNAFKVTPNKGRIQVSIDAEKEKILPLVNTTTPVPIIEISVKDNGPGIDQTEYKKIFKRFYQIGELNKTYYGSTGIGLEMVKSFVELHKGTIEVDSIIGKGSVFKIIIPNGKSFFNSPEEALKPSKTKNPNTISELKKGHYAIEDILTKKVQKNKLLIAEDNSDLQDYLASIFEKEYDLVIASDGQEAWLKTIEHQPDIIITDVVMPLMDGIEFSSKVKKDPSLSHIPIVVLSAKALTKDKIKGIKAGVEAYLIKPFDKKELTVIIEQLLLKKERFAVQKTPNTAIEEKKSFSGIDNDFMKKVIEFVHDNIDNSSLNVEMLSSHLYLSRSQVYRKVKNLTGLSPIEFIRRVRLERARTMLKNDKNLNVNEVAHKVGFLSASYFTVCYKKQFGELPKRK